MVGDQPDGPACPAFSGHAKESTPMAQAKPDSTPLPTAKRSTALKLADVRQEVMGTGGRGGSWRICRQTGESSTRIQGAGGRTSGP
jgi:hypothetical protein